jgi:uncharacterized protein (DUF1330 family)
MAKAYWIVFYKSIKNQDKFAAYVKLAPAAIQAMGGKFIVRGNAAHAYELGLKERVTMIEFESIDKAKAAHDCPAYQEALRALGDGAEREIRLVEALS